jgi:hypothetical protein
MRVSKGWNRLPVWIAGLVSLALIGSGATLYIFLNSESPSFSLVVYPSPIPARPSSALTQCPNPKGLVAFTPASITLAVRETSQMTVGEQPATKLETDPSFWSSLVTLNSRRTTKSTSQYPRQEVIKGVPSAPGATIVAFSCGKDLVLKTEVIFVVPLTSAGVRANCNACTAQYYYIDRRGHALLYWVF